MVLAFIMVLNMSILIMFRRSKYLLATVVATAVLFLPVIAPMVTVNPKVSAESMDEARTNALKYVYTKAMAECIASGQLHKDEEDVQLSQKPETWMEDKTVKVSYLVDADDGERQCGFLLDSALRTLGYTNPADFFKDMGYSCTVAACSFRGNKEEQARNFQNVIKKKNLPTSATPAMTTQIYLAAFQSECEGSIITDPSAAQISDGDNLKNELISIYSLAITDGAPKVTPSVYKYKLSNQTSDFESGRSYTCFDTAPKLRDASKAAAEQQVREFTAKKKELYLKAAAKAACGEPSTSEAYLKCYDRVATAFQTCYVKAFGSGTTLGSGGNPDDVATKGDQGLANCLAAATGTSADTYMTAFQSVKAELDALANSYQTSTSTQTDDSDDCPLPSDAEMRWLGCAVFGLLRKATETLHDYIQQFLYVSVSNIFNDNIKNVSNSFRAIAIGIIILAGLTMIISQALGFELFDAYTIKKLLPRLIVALLGVALAWPLMKLMVILFNDLGLGMGSVLDKVSGYGTTSTDGVGTGSGILSWLFGGAAAVRLLALGVLGGLSLLGTIVLALLIGMIVLAVRQVLILMCVILAPFAIACYVLPGTQKVWAFWKNTFLTALFMYPIIMLFIGAGRAASAIVGSNGSSGAMNILAIMLYFAPYFMLPYAFKMAGGLMSTIFSIANDKNRGVFDRLRKQRQGIRKDRIQRARNNQLWDPNSRVQKVLRGNAVASILADPMGNLAYSARRVPGFRKAGNRIESAINSARTEQTGKLFEELNSKYGYNDAAFRALSGAHSGFNDETRQALASKGLLGKKISSLDEINEVADALQSTGSGANVIAANALRASAGRLATLNKDPDMGKANVTGAGIVGLAAHGFANGEDLAESANLMTSSPESGGYGLEASQVHGMMVQAQLAGSRGRPDIKPGYGLVYDSQQGKFFSGLNTQALDNKDRAQELVMSLGPQDLAAAKPGAFLDLKPHIEDILNAGGHQATAVRDQIFSWVGPYSQASASVKTEALAYIADKPDLEAAYRQYLAREVDPMTRTGARAAGGDPSSGGPPAGGAAPGP